MYSYYAHSRVKNVYLVFLQYESWNIWFKGVGLGATIAVIKKLVKIVQWYILLFEYWLNFTFFNLFSDEKKQKY